MLPFYKHRDTPMHLLHPAAKLAMALSVVAAAIALSNPAYLAALLAGTLALASSARVLREWWRFMRLFVIMAAIVVLINALVSSRGATTYWEGPLVWGFGELSIGFEGIMYGAMMALRLFVVVSAFTVVSLTLHPDEFTHLLARFAYRSGLAVSLSTRFYPAVVRDASAIVDAQRSRGLDLDSGGRVSRIRRRMPVVLPLFHSSLERAVGTAEAMEARGFGSKKRTRWRRRRWEWADALAVGIAVEAVVLAFILSVYTDGAPSFFPTIDLVVGPFTLLFSIVLAALIAIPAGVRGSSSRGGGPDG